MAPDDADRFQLPQPLLDLREADARPLQRWWPAMATAAAVSVTSVCGSSHRCRRAHVMTLSSSATRSMSQVGVMTNVPSSFAAVDVALVAEATSFS
jgi:hypothetical protein